MLMVPGAFKSKPLYRKTIKRICLRLVVISWAMSLWGCGAEKQSGQVFSLKHNDGYVSILWEDREFVPYCAGSPEQRGEYLGYLAGDENDEVYGYRGAADTQWLINYLDSGMMNDTMIFREISVTDIPDGLSSDYEWNRAG